MLAQGGIGGCQRPDQTTQPFEDGRKRLMPKGGNEMKRLFWRGQAEEVGGEEIEVTDETEVEEASDYDEFIENSTGYPPAC